MDIIVNQPTAAGVTVLKLRGELAMDSVPQLRAVLHGLLEASVVRIVVDLGHLRFCDSIGLSAFLEAHKRCRQAGGYVRLAGATPFLLRMLAVLGLLGPIPVYDTVQAACAGGPAGLTERSVALKDR